MRVIAGTAKGHRLTAPVGSSVRPTPDRVKEALFSILAGKVQDAVVLDLFAGSGALGIEALSRGASRCVFVDGNRSAIEAVRRNLEKTGFAAKTEVRHTSASRALDRIIEAGQRFDLIFLDPPYRIKRIELEGILETFSREKMIEPGGTIVLEHSSKVLPPAVTGLIVTDRKKYGDTGLTLYSSGQL